MNSLALSPTGLSRGLIVTAMLALLTPAGFAKDKPTEQNLEPVGRVRLVPNDQTKSIRPVSREVNYIVAPGDTLISIATKLLRPELDWRYLRAVNGLRDERQLVPGQRLRVPANWLRDDPVKMKINAISGNVKINGQPATRNTPILVNDTVETGANGTVLVTLPDGTEMQIAPSSQVRIDRLKKYFGNEAIDARLRLERGGIETRVPPKGSFSPAGPGSVVPDIRTSPSGSAGPDRRFIIETPKATAAVRGTEFRVGESDSISSSAVLEGNVDWAAGESSIGVEKGFGSTADDAGSVTQPEKLLAPPVINPDPAPVTDILTKLDFEAVDGAAGYRVRVARDAAFTQEVVEQVVDSPSALVSSQQDGVYFVAARGISKTGVEGFDGTAKVLFDARPIAPNPNEPANGSTQFSDSTRLKWLQPKGVEQYLLQIASDETFSTIVAEHTVTDLTYVYKTGLDEPAPRRRWWRVASLDDTGQGPFSAVQSFVQRDPGPAPEAQVSAKGTRVSWSEIPEASYVVQVSPTNASASPAREVQTDEPSVLLTGLEPGKYEIRVITVFDGGLRSPPGDAQAFTVELLLRDSAGNPVRSGGEMIRGIQPD